MLRITIVCFIALAVQISALPKYIENLDKDLASLPDKFKHLAVEINSKRAAAENGNNHGYCCTNWQHINNDEIITKIVSVLVPKTQTIVVGYQDCEGNVNASRPQIIFPPITNPDGQPTNGSGPTAPACVWKPITQTNSYLATEFITVTELIPNSQTYCAPEDYKCCDNFVLFNNSCIDQSVVSHLEFLLQLGLIGGVGKK